MIGPEHVRNALVKAILMLFKSTKTKNFIEPENFEKAINSEQKNKWLEAMKTEIESLNETETWDLVPEEKG